MTLDLNSFGFRGKAGLVPNRRGGGGGTYPRFWVVDAVEVADDTGRFS